MRFKYYGLLCVIPMVFMAGPCHAQASQAPLGISAAGQDPATVYLEAWMNIQEAEKLAAKSDLKEAIKKSQKAEAILAAIARDMPEWKPNLVATKRKDNLRTLQQWRKDDQTNSALQYGPGSPTELVERNTPPSANTPDAPSFDDLEAQRQKRIADAAARNPLPDSSAGRNASSPYPTTFEQMEAARIKLTYENNALVKALRDTNKELLQALTDKAKAESGQSVYKEKFDEISAQLKKEREQNGALIDIVTKQYNELEKQLQLAQAKNVEANQKIELLQTQVNQTLIQLAEVTRERDQLALRCTELTEIAEFNSPEKTKELLDRNLTLASKLAKAEEEIARLEEHGTDNEDQIAANLQSLEKARTEVTQTKILLAALRDENIGYRRRISELNKKLANADVELEQLSKNPDADPAMLEENALLKNTIAKQLTVLTAQQEKRELLVASYKKLNIDNPDMEKALKLLEDDSALELTPEEKALVHSLAANEARLEDETTFTTASGASMGDVVRKQLKFEAIGNLAAEAFEKGRFAAAEQLYRTLLDEMPDHVPARVNLGTILVKRKLVDEAIDHLTRADEISPDMPKTSYMLGIAYYLKGSDKEAQAAFTKATSLEPDNAQAYFYLGNIENTAGNLEQAVQHYDNALKINPQLADVHFNKAWTLANSGHLGLARQSYDQAIQYGAQPDIDLQQILDPNGNSLPRAERPETGNAASLASVSPPEIETIESKAQEHKAIKDATLLPPDSSNTPMNPVSKQVFVNNKVDDDQTNIPLISQSPTKPKSGNGSAIKGGSEAPQKAAATPVQEEKPLAPKNARRFRFG